MSRVFYHVSTLTDGLPVRVEYVVETQEIVSVSVQSRAYKARKHKWYTQEFNIIESLKGAVLDRLRAECEDSLVEETARPRTGS